MAIPSSHSNACQWPVVRSVLSCLPWPHHYIACPIGTWHYRGTYTWTLKPSMSPQVLATTTTCLVPNHDMWRCHWEPQLPFKPLWTLWTLAKDHRVVDAVDPSGLSQRPSVIHTLHLGSCINMPPLWGESFTLSKSGHKVQKRWLLLQMHRCTKCYRNHKELGKHDSAKGID